MTAPPQEAKHPREIFFISKYSLFLLHTNAECHERSILGSISVKWLSRQSTTSAVKHKWIDKWADTRSISTLVHLLSGILYLLTDTISISPRFFLLKMPLNQCEADEMMASWPVDLIHQGGHTRAYTRQLRWSNTRRPQEITHSSIPSFFVHISNEMVPGSSHHKATDRMVGAARCHLIRNYRSPPRGLGSSYNSLSSSWFKSGTMCHSLELLTIAFQVIPPSLASCWYHITRMVLHWPKYPFPSHSILSTTKFTGECFKGCSSWHHISCCKLHNRIHLIFTSKVNWISSKVLGCILMPILLYWLGYTGLTTWISPTYRFSTLCVTPGIVIYRMV